MSSQVLIALSRQFAPQLAVEYDEPTQAWHIHWVEQATLHSVWATASEPSGNLIALLGALEWAGRQMPAKSDLRQQVRQLWKAVLHLLEEKQN